MGINHPPRQRRADGETESISGIMTEVRTDDTIRVRKTSV